MQFLYKHAHQVSWRQPPGDQPFLVRHMDSVYEFPIPRIVRTKVVPKTAIDKNIYRTSKPYKFFALEPLE
jgi:hypothetical protein